MPPRKKEETQETYDTSEKSLDTTSSYFEDARQAIIDKLKQSVDSSIVSTRVQAGQTILYIEGHQIINRANDVFGFDGWSSTVDKVDSVTNAEGKVVYYATVTVHALGVSRSDVGCNPVAGDKPEGHDTAIKGAVTDAMKRALRQFGNQFGNSLYNKVLAENTSMKAGNVGAKAKPSVQTPPVACEVDGCSNMLTGYKGQVGWVDSEKQAEMSRKRFNAVLCIPHFKAKYEDTKTPPEAGG